MSMSTSENNYSLANYFSKVQTEAIVKQKKQEEAEKARAAAYNQSLFGQTEKLTGIELNNFTSIFDKNTTFADGTMDLIEGTAQVAFSPIKLGTGILGSVLSPLSGVLNGIFGLIGQVLSPFGNIFSLTGQNSPQKTTSETTPQQKPPIENATSPKPTTGTTTSEKSTSKNAPSEKLDYTKSQNLKLGTRTKNDDGDYTLTTYGLEEVSSSVRAAVEEYNQANSDVIALKVALNSASQKVSGKKQPELTAADENYVLQQKYQAEVDYYSTTLDSKKNDLNGERAILKNLENATPRDESRIKQTKDSIARFEKEINDIELKLYQAELKVTETSKKIDSTYKANKEVSAWGEYEAISHKLEIAKATLEKSKDNVSTSVKEVLGDENPSTKTAEEYYRKLNGENNDGIKTAQAKTKDEATISDQRESKSTDVSVSRNVIDIEVSKAFQGINLSEAIDKNGSFKFPEMPKSLGISEKEWQQACARAIVSTGVYTAVINNNKTNGDNNTFKYTFSPITQQQSPKITPQETNSNNGVNSNDLFPVESQKTPETEPNNDGNINTTSLCNIFSGLNINFSSYTWNSKEISAEDAQKKIQDIIDKLDIPTPTHSLGDGMKVQENTEQIMRQLEELLRQTVAKNSADQKALYVIKTENGMVYKIAVSGQNYKIESSQLPRDLI